MRICDACLGVISVCPPVHGILLLRSPAWLVRLGLGRSSKNEVGEEYQRRPQRDPGFVMYKAKVR